VKPNRIPLALALALAVAALAAGCTQQPSAAHTDAVAEAGAVHDDTDAHADDHDSHAADIAHAAGADFPVPADHVPWTPDAPLVEGMSRVRTALDGLDAQPDPAKVAALAGDIDGAVDYMFANCKLPTEPDVALHAILARLMAGSEALKANPSDASPVADMRAALHNYAELFDDPAGRPGT